jgi:hypothetical protein
MHLPRSSTWGGLKRAHVYGVLISMLLTGVADIVFGLTSRCSSPRRPRSPSR